MNGVIWALDSVARETMLFAAVGFLVGGMDDLCIDLIYLARRIGRRDGVPVLADLPSPPAPGRIAMFVPAWNEAAVIGAMLAAAVERITYANYTIYVGCYPNDPDTIDAVARIAERDSRVRLVIGAEDGPTTKGDCLNVLWSALAREDAACGQCSRMVVLHDAEDVVHPAELSLYNALIGRHSVVQIPVLPLIDPRSRLVSGHYADEFAEAHAKQLVVRVALGAGMPLAGVGCAIAIETLEVIAATHGAPFDGGSLTEDYELGLRIAAMGLSACFARVAMAPGEPLIAVRAYFPSTIHAAVVQKARWMTGIALAGWDRIGWGRWHDVREHWMRMRDRRAPLAVLVLAIAYLALVTWALAEGAHWLAGTARPSTGPIARTLLIANALLLIWRIGMRFAMTTAHYGWREGLWAVPRTMVSNYVALLAARRAILRYMGAGPGRRQQWDKTDHAFPDDLRVLDAQ